MVILKVIPKVYSAKLKRTVDLCKVPITPNDIPMFGIDIHLMGPAPRTYKVYFRAFYRIPEISRYYRYLCITNLTIDVGTYGAGTICIARNFPSDVKSLLRGRTGEYTLEIFAYVEAPGLLPRQTFRWKCKLINIEWPTKMITRCVAVKKVVEPNDIVKVNAQLVFNKPLPKDMKLTIRKTLVTPKGPTPAGIETLTLRHGQKVYNIDIKWKIPDLKLPPGNYTLRLIHEFTAVGK